MARPKKQTVDYFPHFCIHKKTMFIIEQKYGNDGYTCWFKTLEMLGASEGHFVDCSDEGTWEFLKAKARLSDSVAIDIFNLLAKLEAIDPELWQIHRIIWCQKFVDNLSEVYFKRKTDIPEKPDVGDIRTGNGVSAPETGVSAPETTAVGQPEGVSGVENKQIRLNKIKLKKEPANSAPPGSYEKLKKSTAERIDRLTEILKSRNGSNNFEPQQFLSKCANKKIPLEVVNYVLGEMITYAPQIDNFWGYAMKILNKENGNYHGQQSLAKHLKIKEEELKLSKEILARIDAT